MCGGGLNSGSALNNALLYCGIQHFYSYCNVYSQRLGENCTGLPCVPKAVSSCNKMNVYLMFYGLFYEEKKAQTTCIN